MMIRFAAFMGSAVLFAISVGVFAVIIAPVPNAVPPWIVVTSIAGIVASLYLLCLYR